MTSPSQLETVQKEIDDVKAEILETMEALAAAQCDADVHFLRKKEEQLRKEKEQLRKEKEQLREKEIILLQGQASGEHCLPCYLLLGCLHTVGVCPWLEGLLLMLGHFELGYIVSEHIQCIPLGSSVASMQPLGFFQGLRGCC